MAEKAERAEILLWLRRIGGAWYGIGEADGRLVATSVAGERAAAERILGSCLPAGARRRAGLGASEFADRTASMLAAIEAGEEGGKAFELAPDYHPEPQASVYRLVASIPPGYASSYGRVARAAGSFAREVGRLMMNNPLYPLVPCHRVVGSDFSLVGYRGATGGPDLDDKLARLRAEARGYAEEALVGGEGGLGVFPVEWVIARAEGERRDRGLQPELW